MKYNTEVDYENGFNRYIVFTPCGYDYFGADIHFMRDLHITGFDIITAWRVITWHKGNILCDEIILGPRA